MSEEAAKTENPFSTGFAGGQFNYDGRLDHNSLDGLLTFATAAKASDITLQSGEPVWLDVGGKLQRATKRLSGPEVEMVVRAIYGDNGPGEIISGHDLDPSYEVKTPDNKRLRFRVNISGGRGPGTTGFQITIRTLPSVPIEIHVLGIEDEILENLRPPQGLNYITGPTGSGKSTVLSSMIRFMCEKPDANEKVIEFSKPIEFVYDGLDFPSSFVFQSEVGRHIRAKGIASNEESEWAYCIRNALRRKPSMIVLGEARDKATIQGCIEASLTGHLTLSTMHTIGVPETIRRAIMPFPGNERRGIAVDLLECLNLVATQLLLPRIGGGKCAIREYMVFDRKVRSKLVDFEVEEWPGRIREMLMERKGIIGRSMADAAQEMFEKGMITDERRAWVAARTAKDGG